MICHKCGAQIAGNSLRCSVCGSRVNMSCPDCGTLNPFGAKYCSNCGKPLIIFCKNCGSANIYSALECRKCHAPFGQTAKSESLEAAAEIQPAQNAESSETAAFEPKTQPAEPNAASDEIKNTPAGQSVFEMESSECVLPSIGLPGAEIDSAADNSIIFHNEEENQAEAMMEVQMTETAADESAGALYEQNETEAAEMPSVSAQSDIEYKENTSGGAENNYTAEEDADFDDASQQSVSDAQENEYSEDEQETENNEEMLHSLEAEFDAIDFDKIEHSEKVKEIIRLMLARNKHVIGINGAEGSGKTSMLKSVCGILLDKGFVSLSASCTPLSQITSFGCIQNAFLNLTGVPPYTKNVDFFIKDFKKSNFANIFSFLKGGELSAFLNILYPVQKDKFENILKNRQFTFALLEKIISAFVSNNKMVIAVDNFELLDGASYDFILNMLKKGMFNDKLKLIAVYNGNKDLSSYFELSAGGEKIFDTVSIPPLSRDELLEASEMNTGFRPDSLLSSSETDRLVNAAGGSAYVMEQEIAHLFDSGFLQTDGEKLTINREHEDALSLGSFEELVNKRLQLLSPAVKNILFTAAILGYRFASGILYLAAPMQTEKAEEIANLLQQGLYIRQADKYSFEFRSLNLWKAIYQAAKSDLQYKENSKRIYAQLRTLVLSNVLQNLISCTAAISESEEFLIWRNAAGSAAKLGDTNLYVIALKQCLKLIENQSLANLESEKIRIYEEMGRLLCEKSPEEASVYLSNALDFYIKSDYTNINKIIDLSGSFLKSCSLSGRSFGVIEAADTVLAAIERSGADVSALEKALIKTRKLNTLLELGNCGEAAMLAGDEILPAVDAALQSNTDSKYKEVLIDTWFNTKTALAKAYALQGNNKAETVISELYSMFGGSGSNSYYKLKIDFLSALSKTVSGDIHGSGKIIKNILSSIKKGKDIKNSEVLFSAQLHLLDIINRVFAGRLDNLKQDLFELAAEANNINNNFIKNAAKLILGYITELEGDAARAEEIYSEQAVYFSKEKTASGALAAWLLLARKYTKDKQFDKALDTVSKSLEIAQSAHVNNYIFAVYLQKCTAEIYAAKSDFASAKMYLEKAVVTARHFNLRYQLIELYSAYARYIQKFMISRKTVNHTNAAIVNDMYQKALTAAEELKLQNMIEIIKKEREKFSEYCRIQNAG